jgi:transglutaminase-like putative cysteine protease
VRVVRIWKVLPGRPVSRPVEPPEGMEGTLAPSSYIQSDESLIVDLAHQVVGDETDAFQAAKLLERWVRDNVKFDDMKTTFASALEVAERRQGDCTEHGLLLAALARAAGIPSRVVAGLVYYRDSFMGHLWTEVYIDRWVPLDGTRPRGGVGPDHIAFTRSAMETSSPLDLFLGMINVIGNLKIEILETK